MIIFESFPIPPPFLPCTISISTSISCIVPRLSASASSGFRKSSQVGRSANDDTVSEISRANMRYGTCRKTRILSPPSSPGVRYDFFLENYAWDLRRVCDRTCMEGREQRSRRAGHFCSVDCDCRSGICNMNALAKRQGDAKKARRKQEKNILWG